MADPKVVGKIRSSKSSSNVPHMLSTQPSDMSSTGTVAMCKICHCGESEATLISPCRCRGTMTFSHPHCIMRWVNYSNKRKCEICKARYNLKKVGFKPVKEWGMTEVTCDEALHIMLLACSLIIMIGSILWWRFVFCGAAVGYSTFFNTPSMRMMVYITYGPLNGLCLLLALLEIKLVLLPIASRWKMLNQNIIVLPHDGCKSVTDFGSGYTSCSSSRPSSEQGDVRLGLQRSASVQVNSSQNLSNPVERPFKSVPSSMQHLLPSTPPPRKPYPQLLSDNRLAGVLPTTPSSHLHDSRPLIHVTRSVGALDQLYKRGGVPQQEIKFGNQNQTGNKTRFMPGTPTSDNSMPHLHEVIDLSDTASTNRGLAFRPDITSIDEEQITLYLPAGTEAVFRVKKATAAAEQRKKLDNEIDNLYEVEDTKL